MPGFFKNELGSVFISTTPVVWMGILPELQQSEVFLPLSGPLPGKIPELFRNKHPLSKDDIQVRFTEDGKVSVEVTVQVRYGVQIRSAAVKLQEEIERAIATTTGLVVQKVDIKVDRLYHPDVSAAVAPIQEVHSLEFHAPPDSEAPSKPV